MPRTYADIGRGRIGGMVSYLEQDVPMAFDSVRDSVTRRDFASANAAAVLALKEMDAWLATEQKRGTSGFAIGPELFRDMLRSTERVEVSLDTLEATGPGRSGGNLAALRSACQEYAPGASAAQSCMERMNAHKPTGGAVAAAAERSSIHWRGSCERTDIVSVPGRERALVHEAPPYQRFNFAYIDIPGPYEKNIPSIYYIAPPDPPGLRQNRRPTSPAWPTCCSPAYTRCGRGTSSTSFIRIRAKSKFGQVFVGYAFAEGWAHYTEEMMWEAGLGQGDPEVHIGQLSNALLRNVRFLSAIGLHTKGMTVSRSRRGCSGSRRFRTPAIRPAAGSPGHV